MAMVAAVYLSVFVTCPPKDSTVMCNTKSDWSALESEVIKFAIFRDLNGRTGTLSYYVTSDDANNLPPTYKQDPSIQRPDS